MQAEPSFAFTLDWDYKRVKKPGYMSITAGVNDIYLKRSYQAVAEFSLECDILKKWEAFPESEDFVFEKVSSLAHNDEYENIDGPLGHFTDLLSRTVGTLEAQVIALEMLRAFEPIEEGLKSYFEPSAKGYRPKGFHHRRHYKMLKQVCREASRAVFFAANASAPVAAR